MNLTTKGRYGLAAMCELASKNNSDPLSISQIAKNLNLSQRYLEQIFRQLKANDLVDSSRGVKGGYFLTKKPEEITAGEILEALEGKIVSTGCMGKNCTDVCDDPKTCLTRPLWNRIEEDVMHIINSTTLQDLVEKDE
ncbi:MAG: Rrf2 family transcriptional regulator [Tissierellia bacterium]|nr:Rrf2 family transcriptional regulator [Tissierellia bacterium]